MSRLNPGSGVAVGDTVAGVPQPARAAAPASAAASTLRRLQLFIRNSFGTSRAPIRALDTSTTAHPLLFFALR